VHGSAIGLSKTVYHQLTNVSEKDFSSHHLPFVKVRSVEKGCLMAPGAKTTQLENVDFTKK